MKSDFLPISGQIPQLPAFLIGKVETLTWRIFGLSNQRIKLGRQWCYKHSGPIISLASCIHGSPGVKHLYWDTNLMIMAIISRCQEIDLVAIRD